jgi:hypothetical protein
MTTCWPVADGFVAAWGAAVGAAAGAVVAAAAGLGASAGFVAAAGADVAAAGGGAAAPPQAARIAEPGMLPSTSAAPRNICRRERRRFTSVFIRY